MRQLPSKERLDALLEYNAKTGDLYWRPRSINEFDDEGLFSAQHKCNLFNARKAGKIAGTKAANGYIYVRIDRRDYCAHRVIWKMQTNRDPSIIDHINRDPKDNRWANLREADRSINGRNAGLRANNTSGLTGVRAFKDRWIAFITADGHNLHLGVYATMAEAAAARNGAERVLDKAFEKYMAREA